MGRRGKGGEGEISGSAAAAYWVTVAQGERRIGKEGLRYAAVHGAGYLLWIVG